MRAERIILSFVAILIGLLVAGGVFYAYQMTKVIPPEKQKIATTIPPSPTPTPASQNYLTVDSPTDELVTDKKTVTISGKTGSDATIIGTSELDDEVAKPTSDGSFSFTMPLDDGVNIIQITAIFSNGEEKKVTRTVTFSTESF